MIDTKWMIQEQWESIDLRYRHGPSSDFDDQSSESLSRSRNIQTLFSLCTSHFGSRLTHNTFRFIDANNSPPKHSS
jgi:hypothetical protein